MTPPDLNRRRFFRGRPSSSSAAVLRPPWALEDGLFIDACTRCGDCIGSCPEGIIFKGDGGYPEVDFKKGECTFCEACVDHCGSHALIKAGEGGSAWAYFAVIQQNCLAQQSVVCRSCAEVCEVGAIKVRPAPGGVPRLELDESACTGCGACVGVCPVGAVDIMDAAKRA